MGFTGCGLFWKMIPGSKNERFWGGKANPKVYHWAGKCSGQMRISPARTYWAAVSNTSYLKIMGVTYPLAPNPRWSRASPGLLINSLVSPGLHMPKNSGAGSPNYPKGRQIYVVQLKWGYTCALLVASATPRTKRCDVREASEMFCTTSTSVLLKAECASGSPKGLWTQMDEPHPRLSGSIDVEEGLRMNISNMILEWALKLLKTALQSVHRHRADVAGKREVP